MCIFGFVSVFFTDVYAIDVTPSQLDFDCNPVTAQSAEPDITIQSDELDISTQSADPVIAVGQNKVSAKSFEFSRPSQKVMNEESIISDITDTGMVDVIITLDYDLTESMSAPAAERIQWLQEQLMNKPAMLNAPLKRVYENIPAISMKIDQQMLDFLKSSELVAGIEPLITLTEHTAQGLPLMDADVYRSIYNGSGVSIAIIDSGINYNHPAFGGGGFPNAKVIGGYDFGNNDADPIPSGSNHGTNVAGIAAGDITNNSSFPNYIGGVAPGSKLYALKVMPDGSGSTDTGKLTAAIDWCVSHKNDDPANPILVINMSVGGGRYTSSCDGSSSAMVNSVNAAIAAGMTVLSSSGNEGYCDAMGIPACISNVISVGAVFDNGIGTLGFCVNELSCIGSTSGCTAPDKYYSMSTGADKVAPYSNSAGFLDILAPSHNASTPSGSSYTNGFGGTSAACPYASGSVAALQSAAADIIGRFLTFAEVKAMLTQNGDPVADFKNSITTPRVNLANAIEAADIFNGQQLTLYNASNFASTVSSITSPYWTNAYPQAPFTIAKKQSMKLYVQADCDYCDYEDFAGSIVISGTTPPNTNYARTVTVNMNCPACELIANFNAGCAVDLADLAILTDCWLSSDTSCQAVDISGSGSVGLSDYTIMASEWLEGV